MVRPVFTPEEYAEIAKIIQGFIYGPHLPGSPYYDENPAEFGPDDLHTPGKRRSGIGIARAWYNRAKNWARTRPLFKKGFEGLEKSPQGRAVIAIGESWAKNKAGAAIGGGSALMRGGGWGSFAGGLTKGAAMNPWVAAAIAAIELGKKSLDARAGVITGSRAQLEAAEGLMPGGPSGWQAAATMFGSSLYPNPSTPWQNLQRSYVKLKDTYHGWGAAKDTFIESLWEGNGFGRAWTEANQDYWRNQTFKHPDVYKAHGIMGNRFAHQMEGRGAHEDSGWKELGTMGG